ncbi:hypothetical protein NVV78_07210, partial [Pediococcus ethanolidurans]
MDQIEIYLYNNVFHIISKMDFNNLRVWNKQTNVEVSFSKTNAGHFEISAKDILAILDTSKYDRAYIVFDDHQEIDLSQIQLKQFESDQTIQTSINGVQLS